MEEDIKILEEWIEFNKKMGVLGFQRNGKCETVEIKVFENLINKYKEQEKAYTKEIENQCDMVRILVEREYKIRELKEQIDLTERVQKNYKNAFYERTTENAKLRRKLGKLEKLETKLKNVLDKYKHVEASEESAIDIYTELKNIYESGNEQ